MSGEHESAGKGQHCLWDHWSNLDKIPPRDKYHVDSHPEGAQQNGGNDVEAQQGDLVALRHRRRHNVQQDGHGQQGAQSEGNLDEGEARWEK